MTYGQLKNLTRALLIGDNLLSKNNEEVVMLLSYAYDKIAHDADALKLFSATSENKAILRQGPGNVFIRMPELPVNDSDILDIDDELGYVAARFICSFVSREKGGIHMREADDLIRTYNQKVQVFFENMDQYGSLAEYDETDQFGKRMYP